MEWQTNYIGTFYGKKLPSDISNSFAQYLVTNNQLKKRFEYENFKDILKIFYFFKNLCKTLQNTLKPKDFETLKKHL